MSGQGRNFMVAILTDGNPSEQYGIDTANGVSALQSNTTGIYNTAVGSLALTFNTIGATIRPPVPLRFSTTPPVSKIRVLASMR